MARRRNIEYAKRLKQLKQKLKPYRNSQTVNLLRVITGSSGVYLNKYFKTLESVLTGEYSQRDVQDRIQKVVNTILENGEYACREARLNCNSTQIYLKPNVFNSDQYVKTESKANVFNTGEHSDIDSKANVFGDVKHRDIDSKANVFGDVRHSDIDSKANVFDDVKHGIIDQNPNIINRINHVHIKEESI